MDKDNYYIKRIRFKNLFGYRDIDWELLEDVNILGGINGSGKSTIMQCVRSLLTTNFLPDNLARLAEKIDIEFYNGCTFTWCREKSNLSGYAPDSDHKYKVDATKTDDNGLFTVQKSQLLSAGKEVLRTGNVGEHIGTDMVSASEQMALHKDISYAIGEKDLETNLDLLLYREINKRNEKLVGSIRFLSLMKSQKEIIELQRELQDIIFDADDDKREQIQKLEEEIADKINFTSQSLIDIHDILDEYFSSTSKISMKDTGNFLFRSGNEIINYLKLSTGEKQLLLVLLKAFNSEEKPFIMFLDEADLGMHIEWKEKLIKTLRSINPNMQILFDTHAPSVIKGWFDNVKEMDEISHDNNSYACNP